MFIWANSWDNEESKCTSESSW